MADGGEVRINWGYHMTATRPPLIVLRTITIQSFTGSRTCYLFDEQYNGDRRRGTINWGYHTTITAWPPLIIPRSEQFNSPTARVTLLGRMICTELTSLVINSSPGSLIRWTYKFQRGRNDNKILTMIKHEWNNNWCLLKPQVWGVYRGELVVLSFQH